MTSNKVKTTKLREKNIGSKSSAEATVLKQIVTKGFFVTLKYKNNRQKKKTTTKKKFGIKKEQVQKIEDFLFITIKQLEKKTFKVLLYLQTSLVLRTNTTSTTTSLLQPYCLHTLSLDILRFKLGNIIFFSLSYPSENFFSKKDFLTHFQQKITKKK